MPTTDANTVGTGKTYTTLQAWEDACPANLVTADKIWRGEASGTFTAGITISGTTVDSTRYVELTTEAGASFRDNGSVQSNALRYNASNGMAINFSTTYASALTLNQDYTRVSNLQIQGTTATSLPVTGSGVNCDINNCIIEGVRVAYIVLLFGTNSIRNSLLVSRVASAAAIASLKNGVSCTNVTFAVPSDKTAGTVAVLGQYVSSPMKNCAFFGCTSVASGTAPTFTTCYTDVGSPPSGCTTATYNTSQFVNITDATRDYRIPSGSALIDVGTTDSTNAANDIAGTARPSGSAYDVGCWEYVAAGATFVANHPTQINQSVNRSYTY